MGKWMSKNGGSAFPFTIEMDNGAVGYSGGMTLRDYFAAQALEGMHTDLAVEQHDAAQLAANAYAIADAMLAEREKCAKVED
jgi:hypothetical protein